MKVTVTLDIDFRLFKQQKEQLLAILQDGKYNIYAVECYSNLDGIIHTIDEIQDQAAEQIGEEIVFGTSPKEEKEPAYQAAERPQTADEAMKSIREKAAEEIKKDQLEAFSAYQHFLYYFDLQAFRKEIPFGQRMTDHFVGKLSACDIKSLVNWVQEMSQNNQAILLEYILKHHSNKW